jgi:hypothetical protein
MKPDAALSGEDARQIEQLLLRYCSGIDRRDWTLLRSCFTDDFHGDYGDFGSWDSGDAIAAAMAQMHEGLGPTLHRLSNVVSRPGAGGAVARSYVDALICSAKPDEPPRQGIGYYDDELAASAGGWKIRRRRFTLVHLR